VPRRYRLLFGRPPRAARVRRRLVALGPPAIAVILLLALWQTAAARSEAAVLPAPGETFATTWRLVRDPVFLNDLFTSFRRIMMGFAASAAIGVPVGFLLALARPVRSALGPLIDALRYAPVNAFIPLLIILLGIGDLQKIAVIALGTSPYIAVMTSDVLLGIPRHTLQTAQVLGASRSQVFVRVLIPYSLPGIWDALRVALGLAWTYLLTAELVGANTGVGAFIMLSQRFFQTEEILASVVFIAVIGFVSDAAFRYGHKRLFKWFHVVTGPRR
jgi:NitT/TauT family transport system permease protein